MWKHIHSEQNVLVCTRGHISQRINCGTLYRLPGISIVMNQRAVLQLLHPEYGQKSSKAQVPAAVAAQWQHHQPLVFIGMHRAPVFECQRTAVTTDYSFLPLVLNSVQTALSTNSSGFYRWILHSRSSRENS